MGRLILEVRCPKNVGKIVVDPQPDWSMDDLLVELNFIENSLTSSEKISLAKAREVPKSKGKNRASKPFVMRVSEMYMEDDDHPCDHDRVVGRRFACSEISSSEDSEDGSAIGIRKNLMPDADFVEAVLSDIANDQKLAIMEEIRSHVIELERALMNENERFTAKLAQIDRIAETKREQGRKFDLKYQRRTAEELDKHLTAIQRDHEHKSQIEERRIRDDAVREEAQRKERALHEEKVRQAKIEAEAQARLEAAKAAAVEAERRALEEAAKKKTSVPVTNPAAQVSENTSEVVAVSQEYLTPATKSVQFTGNLIRSSENALELEARRLRTYEEVAATNHALKLGSKMDYVQHERNIKRKIKTIRGSEDSVRSRAAELVNLINNPSYPQSISMMTFVDMIVDQCNAPTENRSLYAYARVIVLVASKVPPIMDLLIGKLNKVCIYTVPKHISYSKLAFQNSEAYYKVIGFAEDQDKKGENESVDSFLSRMSSCMKLYGALVQTEIVGIQNLHGLEEGWAWLARFLNALPPNLFTVVALHSFLETAGYSLFRRFKSQFEKLVQVIERYFLDLLSEDLKSSQVVQSFQDYVRAKKYLIEPEEKELRSDLLSHHSVA